MAEEDQEGQEGQEEAVGTTSTRTSTWSKRLLTEAGEPPVTAAEANEALLVLVLMVDPDQAYDAKPAMLTLNRAIEQGRGAVGIQGRIGNI
jgi:hypothetical protein